jgi:hypothetical protein
VCALTSSRRKSSYDTPLHKTDNAHATYIKDHICLSNGYFGARAAAAGLQPALEKRAHLALPRRFHDFEGEKDGSASKHLCRGASIDVNLEETQQEEDRASAHRSPRRTLKSVPWKSLTVKYR